MLQWCMRSNFFLLHADRRISASVFLQQLLYYQFFLDFAWIFFWFWFVLDNVSPGSASSHRINYLCGHWLHTGAVISHACTPQRHASGREHAVWHMPSATVMRVPIPLAVCGGSDVPRP
jgi:hypothetical protein